MARYQISCINKSDRFNTHERILNVGGISGGERWKISQLDAIAHIKNGTHSFYVLVAGREADVIVSRSKYGHEYIKTTSDGEEPNNLLSLPECP